MGIIAVRFHWKGDTKEKLDAAPQILKQVARQVAEEALDLVKQTFEEGKDPYGKKWAPTMRSQWGGALLQKTGRLKASWSIQDITEKGFRLGTAVDYAKYHQYGTGIYGPRKQRIKPKNKKALAFVAGGMLFLCSSVRGSPQRKMVPDGKIPPRWRKAMKAAAEETIQALLGG